MTWWRQIGLGCLPSAPWSAVNGLCERWPRESAHEECDHSTKVEARLFGGSAFRKRIAGLLLATLTTTAVEKASLKKEDRPTELLILGLGNVLMTDDGASVRAVGALAAAFEEPPGVEILDGGTLGLTLLPRLRNTRRIILVDALRSSEAPPGTVERWSGEAAGQAVYERLSPHQIGVADLLFGAQLLADTPIDAVLIGIIADRIELGTELSTKVAEGLPALVEEVAREARRSGFGLKPREVRDGANRAYTPDLGFWGMPTAR